VIELKLVSEARGIEQKGTSEAKVQELKYLAEARGLDQKGTAEAKVQAMKFQSEAKGIENKANAMKLLDAVGREHEEFKLKLNKEKEIELAEIDIRRSVAESQAQILGQALKSAKVDIVGGESTFFESVINAVSVGKTVDRYVKSSDVLSDIKESFFNADPEYFQSQFKRFFSQFNVSVDDVKDMTVSAALTKLVSMADNAEDRGSLYTLMSMAEMSGMGSRLLDSMKLIPARTAEGAE
ncbi:MAG: flotillin family protein, partial [Desulfobacteraceae bacterium]|nr:flotillin family protein [Desulfobacteraceae bacterium]